ncbi:hypothetical protein MKS88_004637 [Plasmodium brasilianum]|uniref:Uncharacterized protein n=1 Tax=Plasmodium brasilianum TaxID=5824 RepID=A0ACB9Y725_PLABR|nr:hypothetical protein MKS88_004637 [Plasmodium brasilianum]
MEELKSNAMNRNKQEMYDNNEEYFKFNEEEENAFFLKPTEFVQNREKILKEFVSKKYDDIIKKNILKENIACTYFQVIPNIVTFTTYDPFKKYERIVSLKNIDKNARYFKLELEENDIFKISYISDKKKKIAPGMIFSFKVEFYPKSYENYEYDLQIYSENKSFTLPIRCINDEIILDVQDEIIIGETPIYMKSEKNITIKNIGKYENKFQLTLNPPFYVNSYMDMLKEGEITQIKIMFIPVENKTYEDYMIINYENGISTYTKIQGKGIVADVYIKDKEITADDIYINTSKEISIFIKNLSFFLLTYNLDNSSSDIMDVNFEEDHKIIEKIFISDNELLDRNIIENELYKNSADYECEDTYTSSTSPSEKRDEDKLTDNEILNIDLGEKDKDKYNNYDKDIDIYNDKYNDKDRSEEIEYEQEYVNELYESKDDIHNFQYSDNSSYNKYTKKKIMDVYPKYKKLYSDTDETITVSICPSFASFFKIVLFLFIKGYKKEEKIVIYLKSIAPEIIISNRLQKIDNILINTFKTLSFELINNSQYDIPVKVEKIEDKYNELHMESSKFIILKNSKYIFKIIYVAKINGYSEKVFVIHQKCTKVINKLYIISNCLYPDIVFDVEQINFNQVSHSFEYENSFHITNNSDLIVNYSFKISDELKDQIKILNNCNKLEKFGKEKITIMFCPKNIGTYLCNIEFFLNEIKTYKKIIPFYAICCKPEVECYPVFLNIDPMIIDKKYTEQVKIMNNSEDTDVKYELILDEEIYDICDLEVSDSKGIIKRKNFTFLDICIKSKIIGYILIVVKIKISGYEDLLFLNIKGCCTCPTIKIIPSIIDFEKCNCLDVKEKIIEIKNESPINAFISLSNELPIFNYSANNFYIEPYDSVFVHIYGRCLETTLYNDLLRVNVHRKEDIIIPIKAQGIGSPILITESCIDFDVIHTNKKYFHELIIFNKGTNERNIYFLFESEKKKKKKNEHAEIFNVTPKNLCIKGEGETVCILSAFNSKEEKCEDILYIYENTINKKKVSNNFKKINIAASFVYPEVEICDIAKFVFNFHEQVEKGINEGAEKDKENDGIEEKIKHMKDINKLMQEIEIKNLKNANIKFILSTKKPFFVESDVIELRSKEKKKIALFFDIDFLNNKMNNKYHENLIVNFFENSKRQKYEISGETVYPNIVMNKTFIDFQYILKNLYAQETVEIKNVCNFKVYFKWFFEENNIYKNFSEVFNIHPNRGYLLPQEKKIITITYNSINENYYNINILCHIKNGPMYTLKLIAGYSDIKYKINKKELNYNIHYKSIGEDFLTIHNTGKIKLFIEILYNIKLPSLLYTNINNFFIEPNNSKDIIFYFIPGIPLNLNGKVLIKICNFEEIEIKLYSNSYCNILHLNIDDDTDNIVHTGKSEIMDGVHYSSEDGEQRVQSIISDTRSDKFKHIENLINNSLLFTDENIYYENQREILIKKLKKMYTNIFLSLKAYIEDILDEYFNLSCKNNNNLSEVDFGLDKIPKENILLDENGTFSNTNASEIDSSSNPKQTYNMISILKNYCPKNNSTRFIDLLRSFILNQKDDNYILSSFSRLKKLVNFEKVSCFYYISNELILKYLKRVILESNIELKAFSLNIGNLIINEKKESVINVINVSHDKIIVSYNLKNLETKDIRLTYEQNEINRNDSINFKIVIQKNSTNENVFFEKAFLCLHDNNYYTINIKFNYIIPDILLYYRQMYFEKTEIKNCLCKINRLINAKDVNIKFKIKNIIFYNKKLEYYHLKKKPQIFVYPTKGIIKKNFYLDIRIFFEPSNEYKNAKIDIEIFIYHSNFTKTIEVYLNSVRDRVQVDPCDIIVEPLLFNSGEVYKTLKIINLSDYSKYLYIYKVDNYYKYLESFIYDLLMIHKQLYIEKNHEKDLFYSNLVYYLIDLYKKKIEDIRNNGKNGDFINDNVTIHKICDQNNQDKKPQVQVTKENKEESYTIDYGIKKDLKKSEFRECINANKDSNKGEKDKDKRRKKNDLGEWDKTEEEKDKNKGNKWKIKGDWDKKEGDKDKEKDEKVQKYQRDELTKKKKHIELLTDFKPLEKHDSNESAIESEYQQKSIIILENKIKILEELIRRNENKYNYFEEYLKIIKTKNKVKENYLVLCPKYINHKKIGSYLLNNGALHFSKKRETNKGFQYDDNSLLTISKIIHWCNEINEKDSNYPFNVKNSFVHYIMHEKNINRNKYSYKKIRISNRNMDDILGNVEHTKNCTYSYENNLDYYISEMLNMREKKKEGCEEGNDNEKKEAKEEVIEEENEEEDELHDHVNDKKKKNKAPNEIFKNEDTDEERTNNENKAIQPQKDNIGDKGKNEKLIYIYKNQFKRKLNISKIKPKIDNKQITYINKKENNYINGKRQNQQTSSTYDEKIFFNKYNLKYKFEYINYFFHFALLNDEAFMNDVRSFLKLSMTEKKKNKSENTIKKKNNFTSLFEKILKKILLSPLYINGVVFFFKKNDYINSEQFFRTFLKIKLDENINIIYLNPIESYEEFFNTSNFSDRKKENECLKTSAEHETEEEQNGKKWKETNHKKGKETNDKKKNGANDGKANDLIDAQRIKYFYENLIRKYQEKIERKLKEKEKIEKTIESLNINVNTNESPTNLYYVHNNEKKKKDMDVIKGKKELKGQTENIVHNEKLEENESSVVLTETDISRGFFKNTEKLECGKDNEIFDENNINVREYLDDRECHTYNSVEKLYEKIIINKKKNNLNKQVISELNMFCVKRNEKIDIKIIKYNKKVNKINNYLKTNNYVDFVGFYKELKIILHVLLKQYLIKGNNYSSKLFSPFESSDVTIDTIQNEREHEYNILESGREEGEKEEKKNNTFLKSIRIELSDKYIEKIYEHDIDIANVDGKEIDNMMTCTEKKQNDNCIIEGGDNIKIVSNEKIYNILSSHDIKKTYAEVTNKREKLREKMLDEKDYNVPMTLSRNITVSHLDVNKKGGDVKTVMYKNDELKKYLKQSFVHVNFLYFFINEEVCFRKWDILNIISNFIQEKYRNIKTCAYFFDIPESKIYDTFNLRSFIQTKKNLEKWKNNFYINDEMEEIEQGVKKGGEKGEEYRENENRNRQMELCENPTIEGGIHHEQKVTENADIKNDMTTGKGKKKKKSGKKKDREKEEKAKREKGKNIKEKDEVEKEKGMKDEREKGETEKDEGQKGETEKDEGQKDEIEKDETEKDEGQKDKREKGETEKDEGQKDEIEKDEMEKRKKEKDKKDKDNVNKSDYEKEGEKHKSREKSKKEKGNEKNIEHEKDKEMKKERGKEEIKESEKGCKDERVKKEEEGKKKKRTEKKGKEKEENKEKEKAEKAEKAEKEKREKRRNEVEKKDNKGKIERDEKINKEKETINHKQNETKVQMEEGKKNKRQKGAREKEEKRKKDNTDEVKDNEKKKTDEVFQDTKEVKNKKEKYENKNSERKESYKKKSITNEYTTKIQKYNINEKEVEEEVYFEELEKKKYEIKDEYDYMFYNVCNSYNKNELIGNVQKNNDQNIIEFLQIDTSYDKKDEISVSISNNKTNCFILIKKLYNFDKVLIGRTLPMFKNIIQSELTEHCEKYLLDYLINFEGINSSKRKATKFIADKFKVDKFKVKKINITKFKVDKLKAENSATINVLNYSEKGKSTTKYMDVLKKDAPLNIDIYKHLYKHIQVLNLYNSSYFDCFVELSFENMSYNSCNNLTTNDRSSSDQNFLIHNDFYVYPSKFFVLSKKCKKIIILFLPRNTNSFFEKLLLSIYSIKNEINDGNSKKDSICKNNKKTDIISTTINENSSILPYDNLFYNNIDISNKKIGNNIYDIFSLCLKGEGIKCSLKIDQNYLNFHKVLLYSIQRKTVEIKNNNYCDIIWFIDSNDLKDNLLLHINPVRGSLLKNEKKIITITVNTNNVNIIKKNIKINYVENKLPKNDNEKKIIYFTPITVEAEICKSFIQVDVDMLDENEDEKFVSLVDYDKISGEKEKLKNDNISKSIISLKSSKLTHSNNTLSDVIEKDINFKHVQVNKTKSCLFKIKNTGKVKISFFVELNDESFLNFISIDKVSDTINSNEMKNIKLKLRSCKKTRFQNIPLFIHIYDVDNNYIQSYKYLLSIYFDYNYLKIVPPILNYDSVEVKKEETRFFKIINDGYFDFKYTIKLLKGKIKNKDTHKIIKYSNIMENKEGNKENEMVNPFVISPMKGLIKSKAEQTITVLFNSSEENYYKYIYIIEIDNLMSDISINSKKKNVRGKKEMIDNKYNEVVKIFAYSVKPRICCDVKNIFEEVFILKKTDMYCNFLNYFLSKNSYYNVDDNTLYYKYAYVNEYINERIKISNTSDVNANVKVEIREIDFLNYDNKKGKKSKRDKEMEKENQKRRAISSTQDKSTFKFHMRTENYNEVKSKWNFKEDSMGTNNSCSSNTVTMIVKRYQHNYVDICFYSHQIVSKKFLLNVYLVKPQNTLCFSFYISVEFFLPSINLIIPHCLLTQHREDKIFDLGNIHLNSIISFKIKFKNCFKYPVFVNVFFEKLNAIFELNDSYDEQANKQLNNRELKICKDSNGEIGRHVEVKDKNKKKNSVYITTPNDRDENPKISTKLNYVYGENLRSNKNMISQNEENESNRINTILHEQTRENYVEKHDSININRTANYGTCVLEKKDIYLVSNNNSVFNNGTDKILLRKSNSITYFDYKNIKDVIYRSKGGKKKHMFNLGYLYYIGNRNYILKEGDVANFKVKIDKKKLQNEIRSRYTLNDSSMEKITEEMSKGNIADELDESYFEEINNIKGEKKKNKNIKKKDRSNKKNEGNFHEYLKKNSGSALLQYSGAKDVLGCICVKILNNNYEFYNLKFLGNIIESKNYWNFEILKNDIKIAYRNKDASIFKNHINFDLVPINYNHLFKVYYTNENNYPLYFNIELDKKIKNIIDIKPLNGSISPNSSSLFYLQIDVKEPINLMKKQIPCKFSLYPFNKKITKIKSEDGVFDDSIYVSLSSEEIKVAYTKKKIIFKNIPFFNYSQNDVLLENLSNVKLFAELCIVPVGDSDDITSVYSFYPFKEKNIISLLKKFDENSLLKETTMSEQNHIDCLPPVNKKVEKVKNELDVNDIVKQNNKNNELTDNPHNKGEEEKLNEGKSIDEFYLTKYDLNLSGCSENYDRDNDHNNKLDSGYNETRKMNEIIHRGKNDQCKAIKKYFTINGRCKKHINVYCFHHLYKKRFDAVLHIKIKFYDEIIIPIKMIFENFEQNDTFILTDFKYNGLLVDKMDEKKNIQKKKNILVVSRSSLNKINHKIHILNISDKSVEYFFEKADEINIGSNENRKILLNCNNYVFENNSSNNSNNTLECVNPKGCIQENSVSIIKFLFNTFNSINFSGNYNLYVNNKKQEHIEFDMIVIEPLIFFNTSSIHINNLVVGKSYCFVFYLINFDLMDVHFEFDKNSYNSFNNKKEIIKIVPFKGTVKSCYRKNKYMCRHLNKSNKENQNEIKNENKKNTKGNNKNVVNLTGISSPVDSDCTSDISCENNFSEYNISPYDVRNNIIAKKDKEKKRKINVSYYYNSNNDRSNNNNNTNDVVREIISSVLSSPSYSSASSVCSMNSSSKTGESSSSFSSNKKKIETKNQKESSILCNTRNKREKADKNILEKWEYLDTSCESDSESSEPKLGDNDENDENNFRNKFFLLNYYFKNIWKTSNYDFEKEIKKILGKGKSKKIKLYFKPYLEQFYNFSLFCKISEKEEPLKMNFKAQVRKININCYIESFDNEKIRLDLENSTNNIKKKNNDMINIYSVVDFKETLIGKKKTSNIVIENLCDYDLLYKYFLQKKDEEISIQCSGSSISKNAPFHISIVYAPINNQKYENYLTLNIADYYLINFKITSVATNFLIHFSFYNYDFGNVILFPILDKKLKIREMETEQLYEESFSSADSSLSSLISTYKINEKRRKMQSYTEKVKSDDTAQGVKGKNAEGKLKRGDKKSKRKEKKMKEKGRKKDNNDEEEGADKEKEKCIERDKEKGTAREKENGVDKENEKGVDREKAKSIDNEKEKDGDKEKEMNIDNEKRKEKAKNRGKDKSSHNGKKKGSERQEDAEKVPSKMENDKEQEKDKNVIDDNEIKGNKKRAKDKLVKNTKEKIKNVNFKKEKETEKEKDDNDIDMLSEEENLNYVETKLDICNNNDEDCYIEYELNERCLKITNPSKRIYLKKKSRISLFILFLPDEEKNYGYKIPFIINNDMTKIVYINITGSASNFKLPCSCNNSNEINFKDVHVDKESINKFTFHNKNSEDISFNVLNYKYLEKYYLSFVKFDNSILHTLKKKEKKTLEIKFVPEKYVNVKIPLYLNISYKGKNIAYYLTCIKLNSVCYKVILKENLLTFNKIDTQEDVSKGENKNYINDINNINEINEMNEINEVKEKLFKYCNNKDSIKSKKIQLHNRGDMNTHFQINYPKKYESFLFFHPKKGIIFSFNLTSIYIFVDTNFISKDIYINEASIELFPKFSKINSKIFFNIFISSCNNILKHKCTFKSNIKTTTDMKTTEEQTNNSEIYQIRKDDKKVIKECGEKNENSQCKVEGENIEYKEKNVNIFSLRNETIITFVTDIRKPISNQIEIFNETESNFKMKYKFFYNENNFFSIVKHEDIIKPNDNGTFEIVYNPLYVQKRKNNTNNYHSTLCGKYLKYCPKIHHISKLVIYYPNDIVKNYILLGYSKNDTYEKKIIYNFKSKSLNDASLRVQNWIDENQELLITHYGCDNDLNATNNDLFFFYINNKFNLSNKEEKNLAFKSLSLREGTFHVMLTFSNEKHEDVYKILLQFEITKCEFLSIKNIKGNKKEILKEQICIYNPLDENIKMDALSDYNYVFFDKSVVLEKKKKKNINIYFCIIKNEIDRNVTISFTNKIMGTYNFKFILNIYMNDFEENFYFNTDLGSIHINDISFKNICNQKINYDVVIEDYDENNKNSKHIFQCIDKTISVKSIDTNYFLKNETLNNLVDKINLTIKYNPPDIRTNKAILKLVSKEGIVYKGLIIGKSVAPKPKGPIFCSSQKTTLISFTNPFFQLKQFFFKVDEHFSVPFENIKVEARQTLQIPVKCKVTSATSGKLLIKSEDDIVWMYYLTGQ